GRAHPATRDALRPFRALARGPPGAHAGGHAGAHADTRGAGGLRRRGAPARPARSLRPRHRRVYGHRRVYAARARGAAAERLDAGRAVPDPEPRGALRQRLYPYAPQARSAAERFSIDKPETTWD